MTRTLIPLLALTLALPLAAAPPPAPSGHRVELPGAEGKPFPYTIEIPHDWQVRQVKGIPGVWLGPSGAEPPNDARLIYVRMSTVSLAEPQKVVASIQQSDTADAKWSAPLVEVRDVGGVKGVWVRMESGEGDKARSTLTLKLPVGVGSVDFISSAPRGDFEKLKTAAEKILLTVRPLKS